MPGPSIHSLVVHVLPSHMPYFESITGTIVFHSEVAAAILNEEVHWQAAASNVTIENRRRQTPLRRAIRRMPGQYDCLKSYQYDISQEILRKTRPVSQYLRYFHKINTIVTLDELYGIHYLFRNINNSTDYL